MSRVDGDEVDAWLAGLRGAAIDGKRCTGTRGYEVDWNALLRWRCTSVSDSSAFVTRAK